MPPELETGSPPADSSAREPAESSAPAADPAESLGSLEDAFRADPSGAALKGRGPDVSVASDDEGAPPEESAPDGASKPGGQEGQPSSRRGAARAIADRDAEIERLALERLAEKERADQAAAQVADLEKRQAEARASALQRIGDDSEFQRLQDARLRNRTLSYEEDARLDEMLSWREHAAELWDLAEKGHRVQMAKAIGDRCERYGLDRGAIFGAQLPEIVDHAVSATEARVRAESANRIAELEAEIRGLRPRAAALTRPAPTTGGASDNGGLGMPSSDASPMDFFRAGEPRRTGQVRTASSGSSQRR
jgi:hypothetical protein